MSALGPRFADALLKPSGLLSLVLDFGLANIERFFPMMASISSARGFIDERTA